MLSQKVSQNCPTVPLDAKRGLNCPTVPRLSQHVNPQVNAPFHAVGQQNASHEGKSAGQKGCPTVPSLKGGEGLSSPSSSPPFRAAPKWDR